MPKLASTFLHKLIAFIGPIMKRVEPLVPRGFECAVVAIKEAVMKLVIKIPDLDAFGARDLKPLKPCVGRRCADPVVE